MLETISACLSKGDIDKACKMLESYHNTISNKDGGDQILHWAIYQGCLEAVKLLVEKGLYIKGHDPDLDYEPHPALHQAVFNSKPEIVEYLLKKGARVSEKESTTKVGPQMTPIHVLADMKARYYWDEEEKNILNLLIEYGALLESIPIAAAFGTITDVKNLIENGYDIDDFVEYSERTALHIAVIYNNDDLTHFLISV